MSDPDKIIEAFALFASQLRDELRQGFFELTSRIDETNARLDQTNSSLENLRLEVTEKLDGISSFLIASEKAYGRLEARVVVLEERVEKIERRRKPS